MSTLGIDAATWKQLSDSYLATKGIESAGSTTGMDESIFNETKKASKESEIIGEDDGKIGFFAAAGNIIKGAAKGLWNGIKSCFTDSEGNFSLGKTLLTVGIGALCIACPVVGVAACGIGVVAGGTKLVTGVAKAVTADTDAEAHAAWQSVGDGGATLVGSALGAKGCFGAMKATSTASLSSVDDIAKALGQTDEVAVTITKADAVAKLKNCGVDNVDEVLGSLKNVSNTDDIVYNVDDIMTSVQRNAKGGSALEQLDNTATLTDKAKAFGQDAWSSTKNNGQKVWTKAKEVKADVDDYKNNKAEIKKYKTDLKNQEAQLKDMYKKGTVDKKTGKAEKTIDGAEWGQLKDKISSTKQNLNDAQAKTLTGKAKAEITNTVNKSETVKYFKNLKPTEKTKFVDGLRTMKDNFSFRQVLNNLSKDGQNIWKFLMDDGNTYAKAVQEFGYDNVAQVLETIYGFQMASNAV